MEKKLKNGLTLLIVNLPVPILKYPKWVEIKYPQNLTEAKLVKLLKISLPEIKKFAKKERVNQIKVATDPSWAKLVKVDFARTVYCMAINPRSLIKIISKNHYVIEIQNPEEIKDLIRSQFVYHCKYKPIYFTCDIRNRIQWFCDLAKENIKKKEGFLLGAKAKNKVIGFLYGEFYKNEVCVDELFVEEKFRKKGSSKALVRKAEEIFQKRNLKKVGLFVGVDEESLGFYKKLGFREEFANWIKNLD